MIFPTYHWSHSPRHSFLLPSVTNSDILTLSESDSDVETDIDIFPSVFGRNTPYFLATLVALHLTPVSRSLGRSFELPYLWGLRPCFLSIIPMPRCTVSQQFINVILQYNFATQTIQQETTNKNYQMLERTHVTRRYCWYNRKRVETDVEELWI